LLELKSNESTPKKENSKFSIAQFGSKFETKGEAEMKAIQHDFIGKPKKITDEYV
jgi:hypothetical protein